MSEHLFERHWARGGKRTMNANCWRVGSSSQQFQVFLVWPGEAYRPLAGYQASTKQWDIWRVLQARDLGEAVLRKQRKRKPTDAAVPVAEGRW
jgi:hypothetical protein